MFHVTGVPRHGTADAADGVVRRFDADSPGDAGEQMSDPTSPAPDATEVEVVLVEIVLEVTDHLSSEEVTGDKTLRGDLGVDSLSIVELVVALEERFGVRIPDEDTRSLLTVDDFVTYVQRARAA
jgi:acyl carrier protein